MVKKLDGSENREPQMNNPVAVIAHTIISTSSEKSIWCLQVHYEGGMVEMIDGVSVRTIPNQLLRDDSGHESRMYVLEKFVRQRYRSGDIRGMSGRHPA
jgi:hypothetical protein